MTIFSAYGLRRLRDTFFPEEIAADRVQTENLIFGFSIARAFQPELIFDSMMKAIRYAQKRLGGRLIDIKGNPLSEHIELSRIRNVINELRFAGFEPGAHDTLYLI